MKYFVFSLLLVISFSLSSQESEDVTNYYFIRHAEKDLSNKTDRDPALTAQGIERSKGWATYFADKEIDMIYSSPYKRTRQTAAPIATSLELPVEEYDPRKLYDEAFQKATTGKNVVVVGHSNTTPVFVNKILGKDTYPWLDESIYNKVYIVRMKNKEPKVEILEVN